MKVLLALTKAKIAMLVTVSTATGYALVGADAWPGLLVAITGTLLLALGAGALNQVQERNIDARMSRTKRRPIPTGVISVRAALMVSIGLLALGLIVLGLGSGMATAGLGALAVVWYNGIYTYLKRWSRYAAVPGAVIGAIPPAIGWIAAGGDAAAPQIWALMFFMFLWQIPHFWVLLMIYPQDYQAGGLPSLSTTFSPAELGRITFIWTVATALSVAAFPFFGLLTVLPLYLLMVGASLWLCARAARLIGERAELGLELRRMAGALSSFVALTLVTLVIAHRIGT